MFDDHLLEALQTELLTLGIEDLREPVGQEDKHVTRRNGGVAALERAVRWRRPRA